MIYCCYLKTIAKTYNLMEIAIKELNFLKFNAVGIGNGVTVTK